jgi:hypothetical protein
VPLSGSQFSPAVGGEKTSSTRIAISSCCLFKYRLLLTLPATKNMSCSSAVCAEDGRNLEYPMTCVPAHPDRAVSPSNSLRFFSARDLISVHCLRGIVRTGKVRKLGTTFSVNAFVSHSKLERVFPFEITSMRITSSISSSPALKSFNASVSRFTFHKHDPRRLPSTRTSSS